MGDAGEGLVDIEARIGERMDELKQTRTERRAAVVRNLEAHRSLESMRLARVELVGQLKSTTHERRCAVIRQAIDELDRRMADAGAEGGHEVSP